MLLKTSLKKYNIDPVTYFIVQSISCLSALTKLEIKLELLFDVDMKMKKKDKQQR